MTTSDALFLDTNILVRANVISAPLHTETRNQLRQFRREGVELWISRQVLREYVSVITRPQTFMQPLSLAVAVERVKYFEAHFRVADETAQTTAKWLMLLQNIAVGGKQIHDANIAATMLAYGIPRLMTYNKTDFERFADFISLYTP